jgi:hypothetical protein
LTPEDVVRWLSTYGGLKSACLIDPQEPIRMDGIYMSVDDGIRLAKSLSVLGATLRGTDERALCGVCSYPLELCELARRYGHPCER